jgi:hypothetical protein
MVLVFPHETKTCLGKNKPEEEVDSFVFGTEGFCEGEGEEGWSSVSEPC